MPRRRIGRSWGNEFGREPLSVYQEKEKERTVALVQGSMSKLYNDAPPVQSLGQMSRAAFVEYDRANDPYVQAGLPPLPQTKKDKGNGPLGALRSLSGKAMHAGMVALDKAAIPGEIIEGAITSPFGKQQIGPDGQVSRQYSPGSILGGIKEIGGDVATLGLADNMGDRLKREKLQREQAGIREPGGISGPFQSLQRETNAFNAGNAPPGVKVGVAIGSDPLNLVGPGAIKGIVGAERFARAGRAGRLAGAIFEQPAAVTAGATLGGAAAAQWGDKVPGLNKVPEGYRPLVGAVAGGMSPGVLQSLRRAGRPSLGGIVGDESPVAAVTREVPSGERFLHGTAVEFEGNPRASDNGSYGPGLYTDSTGEISNTYSGMKASGSRSYPLAAKGKQKLFQYDQPATPEELGRISEGIDDPDIRREFDAQVKKLLDSGEEITGSHAEALVLRAIPPGKFSYDDRARFVDKAMRATGADGIEGHLYDKENPIQSWYDPEKSLENDFDARARKLAEEAPKVPETVKKMDIFGETIDTHQTEAELNGWKSSQGQLFDLGPKQKPAPAVPKGQTSLFDLLADEPSMKMVAERRQRMAGQEGNSVVRMRGDQIGEALGKPSAEIKLYRELDDLIRDASGKPDTKHPQYEMRERVRKAWTQEYVDRNGRQPVFVQEPGSRADRYANIDERVATGRALPGEDTGGEFEGRFDTKGPRGERIMQLEKIANDPTVSPEMRDRARQKLAEEQGAELTGRQAGEEILDTTPSVAAVLRRSYNGPDSPLGIAARAAAGYGAAQLEGEDNSESLKRSLLAAVPASVGRAAFKTDRTVDNVLGAVARGADDAGDGPKVSLESVNLAHGDIKEMPELFQGRDADPGLTYKESRVQSIQKNFDPNRLEPGLVVHDTSTGEYVVIRGHHRLEVMKRKAAEGALPGTSDWQVIDADLTNPADVKVLKKMARLSNFGTAETNLRENLDAYRTLRDAGDDKGSIQGQMRLSSTAVDDLEAIDRAIPQDLIDRLNEMGKTQQESAAAVARVALEAGFAEKDVRAAIGRYVLNPEKARTRAEVRRVMEAGAAAYKEAKAAGLQGGLFGDDEIETVLRAVDALKAKEDAILLEKGRATKLINALSRDYQDNPGPIADAAKAIIDDANERIAKLNQELDDIRNNFNASRRGQMEDVPEVVEPDRTPVQTGAGLFDEVLPPIAREEPPPPSLPEVLTPTRTDLPVRRGTGEGTVGDLLATAPPPPQFRGQKGQRYSAETPEGPFSEGDFAMRSEAPLGAAADGLRGEGSGADLGAIRYSDYPEFTRESPVPAAGRGASQGSTDMLSDMPEIPGVQGIPAGRAPSQASTDMAVDMPEVRGATGISAGRGASQASTDMAIDMPEVPGATPVPGRGRGATQLATDILDPTPSGRTGEVGPGSGQQPGLAQRPDAPADSSGRYRAEIDDTERARINEEWARIAEPPKIGPEGVERGGYVNKLLIEWPNKASRVAFTAATSGDLGSAFIQSGYLAWTHPRRWKESVRQSLHAFGSGTARENSRAFVKSTIEAAVPVDMKADIFERVFKAGGSFAKRAEDYSSDLGSSALESKKLGPVGAFFRGSRRQFETQTEIMRATALADIFKAQRAANVAKGLGDTIFPDQLKGAVNVSNHLTGATKVGMHPAAGIAFGAPRFLMSQFGLLSDAFIGKGISANYARKELIKSFGMITTATITANLALSKGKDAFGPGLGGPQDIQSWDDFKEVITSPNFGRVRVGDADISLFGPLDPLARAFFKEFANVPSVLMGSEDATFPGTDLTNAIANKASPLSRAILDTVAGENKFTGEKYDDFGDYFVDNLERLMPIFAQNSLEAFQGKGSWTGMAAEFTGLKSSPTTPYERAVGILDSIPGEYWVKDAKTNQLRPPATIYELSAKQRDELRKSYPEIETYLKKKEDDPNKPFIAKLSTEYATAQTYWDSQFNNGTMTTDEWRRQFIANQRQLRTIRDQQKDNGLDFEATTQRDVDLDSYFSIWDSPEVDNEGKLNYEAAEQAINALRSRVGSERWDALRETLAWDKSPVVTQYLTDMQTYNDFLGSNPKYAGVPMERTRKVDAAMNRVRELQASNPGLPGKLALYELQDRGEIDADTVAEGRIALGRKYSYEYDDWRQTAEGERVTSWFKPVVKGDIELADLAAAGQSGGGIKLRSGSNRSSGSRRRLLSR